MAPGCFRRLAGDIAKESVSRIIKRGVTNSFVEHPAIIRVLFSSNSISPWKVVSHSLKTNVWTSLSARPYTDKASILFWRQRYTFRNYKKSRELQTSKVAGTLFQMARNNCRPPMYMKEWKTSKRKTGNLGRIGLIWNNNLPSGSADDVAFYDSDLCVRHREVYWTVRSSNI